MAKKQMSFDEWVMYMFGCDQDELSEEEWDEAYAQYEVYVFETERRA